MPGPDTLHNWSWSFTAWTNTVAFVPILELSKISRNLDNFYLTPHNQCMHIPCLPPSNDTFSARPSWLTNFHIFYSSSFLQYFSPANILYVYIFSHMFCLIFIASNASSVRTWIFALLTALSQHLKQFLAYGRACINIFNAGMIKLEFRARSASLEGHCLLQHSP